MTHEPSRILLTGGAGFIGSNLVHHLLRARPDVTIVTVDKLTYAGDRANLHDLPDPSRHRLVVADIADPAAMNALVADEQIDTILHLAAESHVDRSISGPAPFLHTNVIGTWTLLEAARRFWIDQGGPGRPCRFHHVSTDEVYGDLGPDDPAFAETTPYAPSSPYSATKAASDHLVHAWGRTFGVPFTMSNCSNNYGPRQHPEKLIPVVIRSCAARRPIPVYGKGENVRDWLHVDDHCAAIDHIVRHGANGHTYNVGGDNEWKNLDLVREICRTYARIAGADEAETLGLITFVTDRAGHDRRYAIDGRKLRGIGWSPTWPFADGLDQTVAWYLER